MNKTLGKLFVIIFSTFLWFGCDIGEPNVKSLGDSRLNGGFGGHIYFELTPSGLYNNSDYLGITFDGTNMVWMYESSTEYSGKTYEHYGYAEWEVSNGKYRYRGWDSSAKFSKWANYSFDENGNLVLEWNPRYPSLGYKTVVLKKD
jgi:hypothetical protein